VNWSSWHEKYACVCTCAQVNTVHMNVHDEKA